MAPTDAPSHRRLTALSTPTTRPLKAFAFDPSRGRLLGNQMSMAVRYENLDAGPVVSDRWESDAIAVVDYDATNGVYYEPVDLDDPRILIRGGLDPDESDPRFHQQMVYAIATDTIQHFELALGRRIHWRRVEPDHSKPDLPNQGNIYTEVPRKPLMEALAKKSAFVRSDQIKVTEGTDDVPAAVRASMPTAKKGRFEVGSCYVDYFP